MDGYVMRYLVNYGTKSVPLWREVQHLLKDDEVPVMALIKEKYNVNKRNESNRGILRYLW